MPRIDQERSFVVVCGCQARLRVYDFKVVKLSFIYLFIYLKKKVKQAWLESKPSVVSKIKFFVFCCLFFNYHRAASLVLGTLLKGTCDVGF